MGRVGLGNAQDTTNRNLLLSPLYDREIVVEHVDDSGRNTQKSHAESACFPPPALQSRPNSSLTSGPQDNASSFQGKLAFLKTKREKQSLRSSRSFDVGICLPSSSPLLKHSVTMECDGGLANRLANCTLSRAREQDPAAESDGYQVTPTKNAPPRRLKCFTAQKDWVSHQQKLFNDDGGSSR